MMRGFSLLVCVVTMASCLTLAACGGGGGSSGGGGGILPTPPPHATGFVPASGPITLLPSFPSTNALGSTLLASSTAANFIVQSATTPAESSSPAPTLTEYATTETETGGLSTSAVMRSARAPVSSKRYSDPDTRFEVPRSQFAAIEKQIAHLPRVAPSQSVRAMRAIPNFATGDTHVFYIQSGTITGGPGGGTNDCPGFSPCKKITATLEAQSAHANVWVDQHSLADHNQFPPGTSDFTALAGKFDGYYGIETGVFGPATTSNPLSFKQCNPGGSPATTQQPLVDLSTGVINLVVTDALANSGEGGYFFAIDLLNQQEVNCLGGTVPKTNALPMFVMGSDYYPDSSPGAPPPYNETFWNNSDAPRTASHEFQHFIHAVSKIFVHNIGDDSWVDEGCSMLAEDLAANGMQIDTPRFSYAYLYEPGNFSLTSFTGYQRDPLSTNLDSPYGFYRNTAGNYGMSYLFFRYIYDRFGAGTINNLVQSSSNGVANVSQVTGESFLQLYQEWATAVAAQSTNVTSDPRFSFNPAVVLRGPVTVTSRVKPSGSRVLNFAGPQPPEDFTNNPPTSLFPPLSPGATETPKLIDGATMFLEATPTSGGDTVRAGAASSVPAFQASLVQGNYTQSNPSAP